MRISLALRRLMMGLALSAITLQPLSNFANTDASPATLLLQGFGSDALAAAPTTTPPARGIYVWPNNWAVMNGDFAKALAVAGVDGVGVHVEWSEISPALKTYDFTTLDRQLAARSHHLAVELAVAAGQGTPQWLFTPSPLGMGLRRLDFEVTYHGGVEPCHKVSMPQPWAPGYQAAFAEMLAQLSRHLHETGYDRDVSAIKLTGMNTLTEELALPSERPEESTNPNPCVTHSPGIWAGVGYRPALVVQAMQGIAGSYQRYFPTRRSSSRSSSCSPSRPSVKLGRRSRGKTP